MSTQTLESDQRQGVEHWRLEVGNGPARGQRLRRACSVVTVGSAEGNDLVIVDPHVSRSHAQLELRPNGVLVRDLGSKNGTFYLGARVEGAVLPMNGGTLQLGGCELTVLPDDDARASPLSTRESMGQLVGRSHAMRKLYTSIERAAQTDHTVLVQGETGSGKELVAQALHQLSARVRGPFVVVDCAAVPPTLVESHLFGHRRGAFTGAVRDAAGAFTQAEGGTLFLDEVAELPLEAQPKLLRVLESRTIEPVGSGARVAVDVRVVAATHKNLAAEVAAGRFREDLFFRLTALTLDVPPLRARLEDVPALVEHFLKKHRTTLTAASLDVLTTAQWPGNVRQLRNVLERGVLNAAGGPVVVTPSDVLHRVGTTDVPADMLGLPYKEAKEAMVQRFTVEYLEQLLERHDRNVSAAAREARIDRNWLSALARRFGLRVRP